QLIAVLPDWEFWFCGVRDKTDEAWAEIAAHDNVRDLGVLTPEQIARAAIQATVGLIPFVQTPLMVEKSLPLKAFEYVACNLPVVTVPIRSLAKWPELFTCARTAEEFAAAIRRVGPTAGDRLVSEERRRAAAAQDYDRRFATLIEKMISFPITTP